MSSETYQVKLKICVSEEDRCLYESFHTETNKVFDVMTKSGSPAEIVEITFDKCDKTKATFIVSVNIAPGGSEVLVVKSLAKSLTNKKSDHKVLKTIEIKALSSNVDTSGVIDGDFCYEIHRVERDGLMNCMKIIFPMTKDLRCLVPDFGVSNVLLRQLTECTLQTKVRLVSTGPGCFVIPACLTFDKDTCTAQLEFSFEENFYESLCSNLDSNRHLFYDNGCGCYAMESGSSTLTQRITAANPGIAQFLTSTVPAGSVNGSVQTTDVFRILSFYRHFNVMGVDKCTEKVLFSFEICPVTLAKSESGAVSFRIISKTPDYCYEFGRCNESLDDQASVPS